VDGVDKGVIDFSNPTTLRKQKVWSTGTLSSGTHKIVLSWTGQAGVVGGTRVNIDAVDVTGTLVKATLPTVEQGDGRLLYKGTWTAKSESGASNGNFFYSNTTGSSVTINFTGSYLAWLAKKSSVYGIAKVTLDGGKPVMVDLYSASTVFKQAWNTGVLASGPHKVVIEWTGTKNRSATKSNISVDAIQVLGTLN
jgi:hypothetical protein